MPGIQFQFHGEPAELLSEAARWARDDELHLAIERFFPEYAAVATTPEELLASARSLGEVSRVTLGVRPVETDVSSAVQMVECNPDSLALLLGELTGDGLRESALSGASDDEATAHDWRRLVRRIRSGMHKGAIARNPFTGDERPAPSHRHTAGAHELAANGVPMLAIAGSTQFVFDDVRGHGSS